MLELATNRLPKLRAIANLYEALHDNAINYCNLKGNDRHLRASMTGESDIDILFDESQKEKLEQILHTLGFKKFEAIKPKRYRQIVDFLMLDWESGKVIHLHTHYRIPVGKPYLKDYEIGIEDHILRTRQLNDDFGTYCISPSFELILLYFTESLKLRLRDLMPIYLNGKVDVSAKASYEYHWLRKRTTEDEIELSLRQLFNDQISISGLLKGDLNRKRLFRLAPVLRQLFWKSSLYSPLRALIVRWSREITITILRRLSRILPWPVLSLRFNPRGGVMVAVLGDNRAEQLTITRMLKETFRKKIDVYTVDFEWREHSPFTGKPSRHGNEARPLSNSGSRLMASGTTSLWRSIKVMVLAQKNAMKMRCAEVARRKGALVICSHHIEERSKVDTHRSSPDLFQSRDPLLRFVPTAESKLHTKAGRYSPDLLFNVASSDCICQEPGQNMMDYSHNENQAVTRDEFLTDKFKVIDIDRCEPLKRKLDTIRRETWNML